MKRVEGNAEAIWNAFQALDDPEKEAVIRRLLAEPELVEDFVYSKIVDERKSEQTLSLDEYLGIIK